ncbi:MAG TPA: RHS repeat-associated core domain-containing protein [Paludibacteraceae bacterium]|nr:RHS repeat-associated core domain-containing protein [Paludibacteraceae bacterium]HPO67746.1 RHS repeat-associated core domain-containing protein [Paludibacteraceae bacterium]
MVKNGTLYYVHTDNLVSIQAITDENKNIVSSYYYTPWGGRVLLSGANITDRGYTFHEHLEPFGLINMNGRVYDPLTAQFFSPDPVLQAPGDWLNYNRYGYCMGDPLKYTDPSGYVSDFYRWAHDNRKMVATTGAAIVVGAGIFVLTGGTGSVVAVQVAAGMIAATASSITSSVLGSALNGGSFGDCFSSGIKGGIISGATSALGGALSIVGGAGMTFAENLLLGTAEGAITDGFSALLSGTDIGTGMLVGAAAGAILTTVFSENTSNLFKGKGFYTNENVFNHMIADGVRIYNGFYDTYDFDSKPWGTRSPINEIITRTYDSISSGSSFEIFYNQSMLFQQEGFIQNIWLRGNSIKLP